MNVLKIGTIPLFDYLKHDGNANNVNKMKINNALLTNKTFILSIIVVKRQLLFYIVNILMLNNYTNIY